MAPIVIEMSGPAPLPWPLPWSAGTVGKYFSSENPNNMFISCVTDYRVLVMVKATAGLNLICCISNDVIDKIILL